VIVSTTLSDCTGNETLLEYDTRGNIVEITDPRFASAGTPVTTLAYDLGGRLLSVTNELGHVTEYTYDSRNAVLTVEDNLGNVTEYDYDAKGNLTNITDANLNTTTYVYDDADRLVEVIDALSQSTEYGYDGNDNLTAVENAKENTTTYAYDALNRLIEVSDPLSRETTYTYDAAGNLVTRTDARGLVTDYAYDSLNRLTNIDYSGSTTPDVNFTYDAVGNRLSMADGTGTTSYAYDALNRLTEVTFPGSRTVGYQYDNAGNRSRIVYPEGTRDVDYTYDQAGRMLTVTDWLSNVTQYTYNDAGYLTLTELPNGVTAEYGYDTADRLTSVANEGPGGVLSSFTYTLDDVGNRTQVVTPEGTESYTYDDLYRLTGVTYPDSTSESFSYDAVGNRTATAVLAYTYDDADQMLTAGSTSFDYDNNGNQVERGSDTLSYDHENRVVSGMFGSTSVSMAYDGDGLRQALTEGSQTNDFVWDVASGLPVILEDDSRAYVYGLDLISSVDGSNVETYYSHDGLGSVANLTNENGQTTVTYTFNAFGETKSSTGTADNAWQFTGEWKDATTDLYYLRARYLDPTSGRFLSEDYSSGLRGFPVSQHSYGYVANNPTNWVDPTGWRCDKPSGLFDVVDEAVDCGSDGLEKAGKAVGRTARGTWEVVSNSYYDGNITVATPLGGFTTGVVLDPDDGLFLYVGPAAGAGLDPWLVYASAGVSVGPNQDFDGESACGVQGALGPLQGQAGAAFDSKERATPYGEVGLGVGTPGAAGVCYRILPLGVW
jgi:RHS repeat-associated protein